MSRMICRWLRSAAGRSSSGRPAKSACSAPEVSATATIAVSDRPSCGLGAPAVAGDGRQVGLVTRLQAERGEVHRPSESERAGEVDRGRLEREPALAELDLLAGAAGHGDEEKALRDAVVVPRMRADDDPPRRSGPERRSTGRVSEREHRRPVRAHAQAVQRTAGPAGGILGDELVDRGRHRLQLHRPATADSAKPRRIGRQANQRHALGVRVRLRPPRH